MANTNLIMDMPPEVPGSEPPAARQILSELYLPWEIKFMPTEMTHFL